MSADHHDDRAPEAAGHLDPTDSTTTRALLGGGAAAGPVFFVVAGVHAAFRDGFSLSRHPISALSLEGPGWIQIVNFLVTGLLLLAAAAGLRRVLHAGRGGRWGPRLIGVCGVGYVAAGVFVTDAADGFPPGTPEGTPDSFSWHAILHGTASTVAFVAILAACLVLAGRLGSLYGRRWATTSRIVPAAAVVAMIWPQGGVSLRLAIATALTFAWLAAASIRLAGSIERAQGTDGLPLLRAPARPM